MLPHEKPQDFEECRQRCVTTYPDRERKPTLLRVDCSETVVMIKLDATCKKAAGMRVVRVSKCNPEQEPIKGFQVMHRGMNNTWLIIIVPQDANGHEYKRAL
jgi:hypothetical protein